MNDIKQKKERNILPAAVIVCLLSVAVMMFTLLQKPNQEEFVPPPFDNAAQQGVPHVPDNLGYSELNAKAFKASVCGKLEVRGDKAEVYFTNPAENGVWMKLRMLDSEGNILGETGLIRPGEYVKEVGFTSVPEVGTMIELKIMSYEPDTYYSMGAVSLNTTVTGE